MQRLVVVVVLLLVLRQIVGTLVQIDKTDALSRGSSHILKRMMSLQLDLHVLNLHCRFQFGLLVVQKMSKKIVHCDSVALPEKYEEVYLQSK